MARLRDGKATELASNGNRQAKAAPGEHNKVQQGFFPDGMKGDKENQSPDRKPQPQPKSGTKRKAEDAAASDESEATPTTPKRPSGLHDTRPTPGRVVPPRASPPHAYRPETDKPSMKSPAPEPSKKKKRMTYAESDRESKLKALKDPNDDFHDMHICYKKGPQGSPTYDEAGFQLDYKKVADWMKPKAYNKESMVNGMERHLEKVEQERAKMAAIFFVDGEAPGDKFDTNEQYWRDRVSKDLDVPWHKVDSKSFEEWEKRGFEKQNADDWREITAEDRKRMMRMLTGASLRK